MQRRRENSHPRGPRAEQAARERVQQGKRSESGCRGGEPARDLGRAAGGDRDRHEPGIGRRVIRFEDAADVAVQEIAREREVRGAVGMDQRGAGDAGEPHHEADGERGEQGGIDA